MLSEKKFIVYKASAGSGKTYTLVKEYLKIVLSDPEKYRRILAVTFTNKAANEMKSRVITYLLTISSLDESESEENNELRKKYASLIEILGKTTGLDEKKLAFRSRLVLEKILHNYSDFAISTIDSFVQRIIRTFAYDLKIPQNFDVELDAKRVLSQAVDVLLSYAGADEAITRVLVEFVKQKMSEGKNWDVVDELKIFSEELLKEDTQKYIQLFRDFTLNDFRAVINSVFAQMNKLNQEADAIAHNVLNTIDKRNIDVKSFFQGSKGVMLLFTKLAQNRLGNTDVNKNATKTIEEDKWYSSTAPQADKNAINAVKSLITESYYRIVELLASFRNLSLLSRNLYPLSLLNLIEKEVEAIKSETNLIFISDFYRKIHEQLLNEPVPFIYQRTGEKFEHFFIDEFQDTSVLQFQNMLPLIDNSLASANLNLIVGDGKQAIYRWRNGEVMQFASLPDMYSKPPLTHFDDIEKNLKRSFAPYDIYDEQASNINYRSRKEIISFNNQLFSFLAEKFNDESVKDIYSRIEQNIKPGNTGGYVNIIFIEREDYKNKQLDKVLEIVMNLKHEQVPLNDIAVVCRTNIESASVAAHLMKNSVDVVSSESLWLSASPEVNMLISMVKFLQNNNDELAVGYILFYISKHYSLENAPEYLINLYHERCKEDKLPLTALNELFIEAGIDINLHFLSSLPLYDLNEEIIRSLKLNIPSNPFVVFYLDAIAEFSRKNNLNPLDFIEWWNEIGYSKSISVPEELDAVKIMTIHKAKGQEFPVVIYPFADEAAESKGKISWIKMPDKLFHHMPAIPVQITKSALEGTDYYCLYEQEKLRSVIDMLNICYVALTRAENQLYVITKKEEKSGEAKFGILLQDFLKSEGLWSDDKLFYEFGDSSYRYTDTVKEGKHIEKVTPDYIISENWLEKINIRYNSNVLWDDDVKAEGMKWGNIVHDVLSGIKDFDDAKNIIDNMLTEGIVNEREADEIKNYVNEMFSDTEISQFFSPGLDVRTEADIITPENKLYRPDRVIFEKDRSIVIDFKTGAEQDKHKTQILNYAALLSDINGKSCDKYLIYLQEKARLVKV